MTAPSSTSPAMTSCVSKCNKTPRDSFSSVASNTVVCLCFHSWMYGALSQSTTLCAWEENQLPCFRHDPCDLSRKTSTMPRCSRPTSLAHPSFESYRRIFGRKTSVPRPDVTFWHLAALDKSSTLIGGRASSCSCPRLFLCGFPCDAPANMPRPAPSCSPPLPLMGCASSNTSSRTCGSLLQEVGFVILCNMVTITCSIKTW